MCQREKKKDYGYENGFREGNELGGSTYLLKETAFEGPKEYFATLRMTQNCFNFLLMKLHSQIRRKDTHFRSAITEKKPLKLQAVRSGCSLMTLTNKICILRFVYMLLIN